MMLSSGAQNIPFGWIAAGLLLVVLVGISFSIGEAGPEEIPTMAIDEDLAPLQSGALDYQDQYADLIVPVSLSADDVFGGTAP